MSDWKRIEPTLLFEFKDGIRFPDLNPIRLREVFFHS